MNESVDEAMTARDSYPWLAHRAAGSFDNGAEAALNEIDRLRVENTRLYATLERYEHYVRDHGTDFELGDVVGALAAVEHAR